MNEKYKVTHWIYSNRPELVTENFGECFWDREIIDASQFSCDDSEVVCYEMVHQFCGNPAGSIVVTGSTVSGARFDVIEKIDK